MFHKRSGIDGLTRESLPWHPHLHSAEWRPLRDVPQHMQTHRKPATVIVKLGLMFTDWPTCKCHWRKGVNQHNLEAGASETKPLKIDRSPGVCFPVLLVAQGSEDLLGKIFKYKLFHRGDSSVHRGDYLVFHQMICIRVGVFLMVRILSSNKSKHSRFNVQIMVSPLFD